MGVWLSASAVLVFAFAVSVLFSAQVRGDYAHLADNAAQTHAVVLENYTESLRGSFAALCQIAEEFETTSARRAFLVEYAANHPNIAFIGVNNLYSNVGSGDHAHITREIHGFPGENEVFLLGLKPASSREYALGIRAEFGGGSSETHTLMVVYSPDVLDHIISTVALPFEGRLSFVDPAGNALDQGRVIREQSLISEPSRGREEVMRVRPEALETEPMWRAAIIGDVVKAREFAGVASNAVLATALVLLIAALFMSIALSKRHSKPIEVISAALERFKKGEPGVRADVARRNDYGVLAARFNDYIESTKPKPPEENTEKKIERLRLSKYNRDAITGAYTAESLSDCIRELALSDSHTQFAPFAVIHIALDGFEEFIHTYSHTSGDLLLKFTVLALRKAARERGVRCKIGRHGKAEFLMIIQSASEGVCKKVEAKIVSLLGSGYTEDTGKRIVVKARLGRVVVNNTPIVAEEVIAKAAAKSK